MNCALIFAGGTGKRVGHTDLPKQFLECAGKPVLVYTLDNFQRHTAIDRIVLVCLSEYVDLARFLVKKFGITKVTAVVEGGQSSQESIYNGLAAIESSVLSDDLILFCDGVRPFVSEETITNVIECAKHNGNGVAVVPAIETIVGCNGKVIKQVMDRKVCAVAKAPQCFRFGDIWEAHCKAKAVGKRDFIDSASLMRYYGHLLYVAETSYDNIKITTQNDFWEFCLKVEAKNRAAVAGGGVRDCE